MYAYQGVHISRFVEDLNKTKCELIWKINSVLFPFLVLALRAAAATAAAASD